MQLVMQSIQQALQCNAIGDAKPIANITVQCNWRCKAYSKHYSAMQLVMQNLQQTLQCIAIGDAKPTANIAIGDAKPTANITKLTFVHSN